MTSTQPGIRDLVGQWRERWVRFLEDAGFASHVPALPGRDPTDHAVLGRTGIAECLTVIRAAYDQLDEPPILIGHSIGGLLGQKLAATTDCRALVLLASIPPGVLWPQLRPLRTCSRSCPPSCQAARSCLRNAPCVRCR